MIEARDGSFYASVHGLTPERRRTRVRGDGWGRGEDGTSPVSRPRACVHGLRSAVARKTLGVGLKVHHEREKGKSVPVRTPEVGAEMHCVRGQLLRVGGPRTACGLARAVRARAGAWCGRVMAAAWRGRRITWLCTASTC
jgi:hypothetical protein